jgi:hypothetical protein
MKLGVINSPVRALVICATKKKKFMKFMTTCTLTYRLVIHNLKIFYYYSKYTLETLNGLNFEFVGTSGAFMSYLTL